MDGTAPAPTVRRMSDGHARPASRLAPGRPGVLPAFAARDLIPGLLCLALLAGLAVPARTARAQDCGVRRIGTLPLEAAERPEIQVAINGQLVRMLVDTGAQVSMVTPDTVAALRLPRDPRHASRVMTIGGEATSRNAILAMLELAGARFQNLSVAVSALDEPHADPRTAPAGVIGADLLHDFDLDLDIPGRALTLYRPDRCAPSRPPWTKPYDSIPAIISGRNQFMLDVALNGKPVRAIFDTGSRGETVSRALAIALGVTDQALQRDPAGVGLTGGEHDYRIRRHIFKTLRIGTELFRDLPLDVVEFHLFGVEMLLGVDYMRSRRFYLSYAAGLLYVRPAPAARDPHAPVGVAHGAGCQAPPDLLASLSRAPLVVVARPALPPPAAARDARIDGCVGVLFRLGADGTPTDVTVVAEAPDGYGLGAYVARELAVARFERSPDNGWHYEVERIHLGP